MLSRLAGEVLAEDFEEKLLLTNFGKYLEIKETITDYAHG